MVRPPLAAPLSLALGLAVLAGPARPQCEQTKLLGGPGGENEQYGNAVAVAGDDAIVGRHFYDGVGENSGAVTILRRQPDGTWAEVQQLLASDEAAFDRYGWKVAIDGGPVPTAVVGARYNQDVGYGSGSAYVYEFDGSEFVEAAYLTASDEQMLDLFGTAVAVSGDVIVVGANSDSDVTFRGGSAYVFERSGGSWSETVKLTSTDPGFEPQLGSGVAAWCDGVDDVLVVGAPGMNVVGQRSGAAYVFERQGATWVEAQRLVASDAAGGDELGWDVAVEGDVAVLGAQRANGAGGADSGKVYVFEREGGVWSETAILEPDDGQAGDLFGAAVDVSDGLVLVGSWSHDAGRGAVYLFEDSGAGWVQTGRLSASDGQAADHFGHAVALSGSEALVGARRARDGGGTAVGAVYGLGHVGALRTLGAGCVGTGGFTPRLSLEGCPVPGGSLTLSLRDGLGGALAALYVGLGQGHAPLPTGCAVNIDPFLFLLGPFSLGGAAPGDGSFDIPLDPPPGTPDLTLAFQVVSADPGVPGLVFTNGVEVTVSSP